MALFTTMRIGAWGSIRILLQGGMGVYYGGEPLSQSQLIVEWRLGSNINLIN